jgi:hypothetical protein
MERILEPRTNPETDPLPNVLIGPQSRAVRYSEVISDIKAIFVAPEMQQALEERLVGFPKLHSTLASAY